MSVPSSKMIVTPEIPNCENERTSLIRGMPFIEFSTGIVMNCSISSGPSAGALVRGDHLDVGDIGHGVDR